MIMPEETKLCLKKIRDCEYISNHIIDFFSSSEDKYIFGTSRQAAVCLEICRCMKVPIRGMIGADAVCILDQKRKGYWQTLMQRVPVYTAEQAAEQDKNAYILMAVGEENYKKGEKLLRDNGLQHIFRCEWKRNYYLRQICYEVYQGSYEKWLSGSRSWD